MNINDIVSKTNSLIELSTLKENFERAYMVQDKLLTMREKADKVASMSYPALKEAFELMSGKLFTMKEGRKLIAKYINESTTNQSIKNMHLFVEAFHRGKQTPGIDIPEYISMLVPAAGKINSKELKEGRERIASIVREGYLMLGDNAEATVAPLNEEVADNLEYIALTEKTIKNLHLYTEKVNMLRDYHEELPTSTDKEEFDSFMNYNLSDEELEDWFKAFSEKYGHELSDDEKGIVRRVAEMKDNGAVYSLYKEECLASLNEAVKKYPSNDAAYIRLTEMADKINRMAYNKRTFGEDIQNFTELKKLFSE